MCELLNVMDSKIVQVALNGLDNILKAGELHNTKPNPYAVLIEECYGEYNIYNCTTSTSLLINLNYFFGTGLDKIEFLQSHEIKEIYQKSFFIIEQYFGSEEEDTRVAPSSDNNQYQFSADQSVPMGGYQF